jgi:hypothetical protein
MHSTKSFDGDEGGLHVFRRDWQEKRTINMVRNRDNGSINDTCFAYRWQHLAMAYRESSQQKLAATSAQA